MSVANLSRWRWWVLSAVMTVCAVASPAHAQQGVVLTGQGAPSRAMGGANVAAPVSATGALFWNPATAAAFQRSEMEFGAELLYAQSTLSSYVPGNSLGAGIPPINLGGSTNAENGVVALPSLGLIIQSPDSPVVFGLGIYPAGGFGLNYPADPRNPVLSPRPPYGLGAGAMYTRYEVMQIAPSIALRVTDRLSVGFAPILDMANLQEDPGFLAAPDDANGDGRYTYPSLTHSRTAFGGGFQFGVYYNTDNCWHFGASVKSPQWMEPFRFNAQDEVGRPRSERFQTDFPLIAALGTSYTGIDRLLIAGDLRYVDYANTTGFRAGGYDPFGALRGVGWRNTFGVALGAQYKLTDAFALMAGYSWNDNPIPSGALATNLGSSVIEQNTVSAGFTYDVSCNVALSLAYLHVFHNSVTGPLYTAQGTIPGASVTSELAVDCVVAGVIVRFGR